MRHFAQLAIAAWIFLVAACAPSDPDPDDAGNELDESTPVEEVVDFDTAIQVAEGVSYILEDGEERHRLHPETFWIPDLEERKNLQPGQLVKLIFDITADGERQSERMWVLIDEVNEHHYLGTLDNDPTLTEKMKAGLKVHFQPHHVIHIYEVEE